MAVREFEKESDYRSICAWWAARDCPPIPEDMLPTFGLIVPNVAAGFLIATDCNLGYLEFYISNPESKAASRDQALNEITKGLIQYGVSIGIMNFKCDTHIEAIKARAKRIGFKDIGQFSNLFLRVRE